MSAVILGVAGFALTTAVISNAVGVQQKRTAEKRLQAAKIEEADTIASHAAERRRMVTRADSVLRATPVARIARLKTETLFRDVAIVEWLSDPTAKRWVKAATGELRARSSPIRRRSE